MSQSQEFRAMLGNDEIIIETGKLAQQAGGAVTVRLGDSMVLVTATGSKEPRQGIDFFPLTVDFEERRYAVGKIPGGFFKREGRPSTEATLLCRTIDRPIRPLFPKGYRNDVHIVVTPFASDQEHHLDIISMIGASAALTISDVPFGGPVGAVRMGYVDGEFVVNPTIEQMASSTLDLAVAGTAESVLMIEAGASEFPEDMMMDAITQAHEAIQQVIAVQRQMAEAVGKEKKPGVVRLLDADVLARVRELAGQEVTDLVAQGLVREDRQEQEGALLQRVHEQMGEDADDSAVNEAFDSLFKEAMRRRILDTGIRVDGRDLHTIRDLSAEIGLVPRAHGTGLFNRGQTQALAIVTLGTGSDEQKVEGLSGETTKRYMHHYNFPPYSTGEAGMMRGPRRREIGHGALAEKAIEVMLPDESEFPYTIRTVTEVLSSNGSTSMASTCACSLALFDAGVPMKAAVAGMAMGVITEGDRWAVMTDIQGLEDHLGDMDFKVAGTANGITAIQLDIKITGLRREIIEETLQRSRDARLKALDVMNAVISEPRAEISVHAPHIQALSIPVEKIGALIGPGGKNIRSIIEDTGVSIDVEDDGTVLVASSDGERAAAAIRRIQALTAVPELGRIYTGKVVRITDFGAFVEFIPGQDGLVHISQLADYRVNKVEDVVQEGDEVMVMVIDVDSSGRVKLSRQAVLEGWNLDEARQRDRKLAGGRGDDDGGPRRGGDRGGDRRGGGRDGGGRGRY